MTDEFAPDNTGVVPPSHPIGTRHGPAKRYGGLRFQSGCVVFADGWPLSPKPSLLVWNHSPTGFEWGYGGSGPAQLALAILLHEGLSKEEASARHQRFKREVVAELAGENWTLEGDAVREWIVGDRAAFAFDQEEWGVAGQ